MTSCLSISHLTLAMTPLLQCPPPPSSQVLYDSAPVGGSPYRVCIYNSSIAFPEALSFSPLRASNTDTLPNRPSTDYSEQPIPVQLQALLKKFRVCCDDMTLSLSLQ